MDKPFVGPEKTVRCVGRTQNIEEANLIAQRYETEGYETEIIRKKQSGLTLYEIWVGKKPDIFSVNPDSRSITRSL
jgi:hypothetical protein